MTWNDVELTPRGNHKLRYDAVEDECRVIFYYLELIQMRKL